MRKRFAVAALVLPLLFSTMSPSFATGLSSARLTKPISLVGLTEVQVITPKVDPSADPSVNPIVGTQIKLYKSNSYTARVKVGEVFQLQVTGLWPNLVSAPVMVSPKGMSANLTSTVPDLDGIVTLPVLRIIKKGNYTLIIRQPDEPKAVMAKIKVSK